MFSTQPDISKSSGQSVEVALCGVPIEYLLNISERNTTMHNLPREKLRELIQHHGTKLCENVELCESLLFEACSNKYEQEILMLVDAIEEDIVKDLLKPPSNLSDEALLNHLVDRLQENLGLKRKRALWIVQSWNMALEEFMTPTNSQSSTAAVERRRTGRLVAVLGAIVIMTGLLVVWFCKRELGLSPEGVPASSVAPSTSEPKSSTTSAQPPEAPAESEKPLKTFRDTLKDGSLGPRMVVIPAGRWKMGDIQGNGEKDEQPVHWVSVDSFAMALYEITFSEYDHFAIATGRKQPSDQGWRRGHRPVIHVSWNDARAYTQWLSEQTGQPYRLPTEAEWEYSARATTETTRYWGHNANEACDYGNVRDQSLKQEKKWSLTLQCTDGYVYTAPIGRFKPNAFGLFDMLGNVREWTCSQYQKSYRGEEQRCTDQNKNIISIRGGSWGSKAHILRAAKRASGKSSLSNQYVGFRVAK